MAFPQRQTPGQVVEDGFGSRRTTQPFRRLITDGEDLSFNTGVDAPWWLFACS
jgi:hypothetical protein